MKAQITVTDNAYDETTDTITITAKVTIGEEIVNERLTASYMWGLHEDAVSLTSSFSFVLALELATVLIDEWQNRHDDQNPGDSPVCTDTTGDVYEVEI